MPSEKPVQSVPPSGTAGGLSVAGVLDSQPDRVRLTGVLDDAGMAYAGSAASVAELSGGASGRFDALVVWATADRGRLLSELTQARETWPETGIIAIWPSDLRREDRRVLKAGADGVVIGDQVEATLGSTLRAVASGLVCVPRNPAEALTATKLSSREKQVLGMLIMGFTNAEIGRRLYLAESTVKSHLSSAYLKLGVRSRKDAAALVLDPDGGLGTGILAISGSPNGRPADARA